MAKAGDKIKVIYMNDPYASDYNGRVGTITRICNDPWGDLRYEGTWGGLAIYPCEGDKFEIIEKGENNND